MKSSKRTAEKLFPLQSSRSLPARFSSVSKTTDEHAKGRELPVLVVYGPTASGKSGFVLEELASVCPVPIEIISADSMQVYCGLDIGTAKPDAADLARLPHHLVDIRNPDEVYDAESFARD